MAYEDIVEQAATAYGVPVELIRAVMKQESGGAERAVSKKGAQGLMQLMPETARDLGVADPFDPIQNIHGGVRYLRQMYDRFGDWRKALAAYNAGPGAVEKYGGVPPYAETQGYVRALAPKVPDTGPVYVSKPELTPEVKPPANPFEDKLKAFGMGYDVVDEPYYRKPSGVPRRPETSLRGAQPYGLLTALPQILEFSRMFMR